MKSRVDSHGSNDLRNAAFTLVELLVSMTVLVLMAAMLVNMTSAVNKIWLGGRDRMDSFTRARSALDVITRDVESGLFRADVNAFVGPVNGTSAATQSYYQLGSDDAAVFYTQRPGIPRAIGASPASAGKPLRSLSLVSYQIAHNATAATLRRGDFPVDWDATADMVSFGLMGLPNQDKILYQDVCPGVLRVEFYFLRANGCFTISSKVDPTDTADATGTIRSPVQAVIVDLAVVDETAQKILASNQRYEELRDRLVDKSGTSAPTFPQTSPFTISVRSVWEKKAAGGDLLAGFPAPVKEGLRFYERFIYLPRNQ